jgi:DnaK suppressor protein
MAAKKAQSKKRAKSRASRKTAATRKSSSRKKTAGKKSKVTRKKPAKKSTKKPAARKKPASKKKAAKKKAAPKKSVAKKKAGKKAPKGKKAISRKKASTRKSAASKKSTKKTLSRKKSATPKSKGRVATATKSRPRGDILSGPIHGIAPYVAQRGENYMSKDQLEHFAAILNAWKRELMDEVDRTVHHMQDEAANFPDPNDRATQESEFGLELRTRDRERKLLRKINAAIARIEDGTYGYCEETGEEIGLKRLEARPVATLCLEAQERREMSERQFRDRDDRYR